MKLNIYKYPEGKNTKFGHICIKKEFADLWYNEVMKRFKEKQKESFETRKIQVFDVDETYETGEMSLGHLEEMIKFLKNETNNKRY